MESPPFSATNQSMGSAVQDNTTGSSSQQPSDQCVSPLFSSSVQGFTAGFRFNPVDYDIVQAGADTPVAGSAVHLDTGVTRMRPITQEFGCTPVDEWNRLLKSLLHQPETRIFHTVLFPAGFDYTRCKAGTMAEITEEKAYKLKPGEIPDFLRRPAALFDVDLQNIPAFPPSRSDPWGRMYQSSGEVPGILTVSAIPYPHRKLSEYYPSSTGEEGWGPKTGQSKNNRGQAPRSRATTVTGRPSHRRSR